MGHSPSGTLQGPFSEAAIITVYSSEVVVRGWRGGNTSLVSPLADLEITIDHWYITDPLYWELGSSALFSSVQTLVVDPPLSSTSLQSIMRSMNQLDTLRIKGRLDLRLIRELAPSIGPSTSYGEVHIPLPNLKNLDLSDLAVMISTDELMSEYVKEAMETLSRRVQQGVVLDTLIVPDLLVDTPLVSASRDLVHRVLRQSGEEIIQGVDVFEEYIA